MKRQDVILVGIILALIIGGVSLFSWNTAPTKDIVKKENIVILESNQNMVTNEFKIFSDFIYDIGPRFGAIKKSEIEKITSINGFLNKETIQNIVNVKSTSFIILKNDEPSEMTIDGKSATFNKAQLKFIKSIHYSTNFALRVEYEEKEPKSGYISDNYSSPYLTIVPEQQAKYSEGIDALKLFLKESCQTVLIGVDPEKLKPAKLYFTVTKDGAVENISLDRDSGYPNVDKKMIELIKETPEKWIPAKNMDGENVDQELVVSFGLMGC
ncbi:energy transducer TonB [Psychroserpens sp.]|uniref:energy transducer TonB n=1 Tax=Psychroserpens sp. TaxID=2020870 RepID=UPI00385FADEE